MSLRTLYDEASLWMTPGGYEDGKLFSELPTDGSGDFTFSRGSNLAATRVGPTGLIEKGRENVLLQSNQFDITWNTTSASVTNGQSGYDGSNDAWLLSKSGANGRVQQFLSKSGVQTFSVYAKANTATWLKLQAWDGSSFYTTSFNLSNGALGSLFNLIDANTEDIGGGWYHCSISLNASTQLLYVFPAAGDNDTAATSGSIYIQDAQLEAGLVATDYIETGASTAQAGILEDMPRLDYSGGASCPALLLEPQRTNLIPQSEYFGDWSTFRSSIIANDATSPENYTNSYKLIQQSGETTSGGIFKGISVATSTAYTYSFFAKAAGYNWCYARVIHSSDNFYAWFDLDNGVVGSTTGSGVTSSIEDYGSGWYKCSITYTSTTTLSDLHIYIADTNGSGTLSNPDGVKGIHIYGAQMEQGSYPTSYIPTYGASVTRSRDTGSLNMIDAGITTGWTSATLFIEYEKPNTGEGVDTFRMHGTSSNGRAYIYNTGNGFAADWGISGGHTLNTNVKHIWRLDSLSEGTRFKNGAKENSGSGTAWSDIRYMYLNNQGLGGTLKIKQIALFPTALTDSECIALTTL